MNKRHRALLLLFVTAILHCHVVMANGGPVAWTGNTAHSGVVPNQENSMRLVREKLDIQFLNDLNHYKVEARYQIENAGPKKTIRYGVPINWNKLETVSSVAKTIRVTVNGQKHACQIVVDAKKKLVDPKQPVEETAPEGTAWCMAELAIPSGGSNELVLEYTGELVYEDWETSKSPLTEFSTRKLLYDVWPAGYWRGPVEQMDVRIHLGPYRSLVKSHNLADAKPDSHGGLSKIYRNLDLRSLVRLEVEVEGEPILHPRQLVTWNRTSAGHKRIKTIAKASSVLSSQGMVRYEAANALDGDPKTAWCAGGANNGIGEWVELRFSYPKRGAEYSPQCRFQGFAIVPGYAKSVTHLIGNNRVRKLRVAHCDAQNNYRDVALSNDHNQVERAVVMVYVDYFSRLPASREPDVHTMNYQVSNEPKGKNTEEKEVVPSCYRLTILDVLPGKEHQDTCLSEIAPVFNCL